MAAALETRGCVMISAMPGAASDSCMVADGSSLFLPFHNIQFALSFTGNLDSDPNCTCAKIPLK